MSKVKGTVYILTALIPVLGLSACGESDQARLLNMVETKQTQQALELAQKELKNNPDTPIYNAIMAQLLAETCVPERCPTTNPEKLTQIRNHLNKVSGVVEVAEGQTYNVYDKLPATAERFLTINHSPEDYLKFVQEALPENAPKARFISGMKDVANGALRQGQTERALTMLRAVSSIGKEGDPSVALSNYMLSFIDNGGYVGAEKSAALEEVLKNNPNELRNFIQNISYLIFVKTINHPVEENRTFDHFIESMTHPFETMGMPSLNSPENRKQLSIAILETTQDDALSNQLGKLIQDPEGTTTDEQKSAQVRTKLLRFALITDPANRQLWAQFFAPALETAEPNTSLSYLYDNIDLSLIPPEVVVENNKAIIERAEKVSEEGGDVSFLLKEIIYRPDAQQLYFDEAAKTLVKKSLTSAIEREDYKQAINYVQFSPDQAAEQGEKLATTLKQGVRDLWEADNFVEMEEVANFMRTSLRIPYSLDVELLDFFTDYLNSDEVQGKLRADKPDHLLLTREEAQVDLGPKMAYILDRFKERPDIVQARLKTLAIEIPGAYSTANTLHSLAYLFNDKNLNELISNAIKSGIVNDQQIEPQELALVGSKLILLWPDINYNFIINEVFKRVENIDDARAVWKVGNKEFKDNTEKLRPQLASLMKGIDLFEKGNITEAATFFTVLSDPQYVQAAQRYTKEYDLLIEPFVGTYYYQKADDDMHIAVLRVDRSQELLQARVEMTNLVGSLLSQSEFLTDNGQVITHTFDVKIDPETMLLTIPDDQKTITVETGNNEDPTKNLGLERIYGLIKTIKLMPNQVLVTSKNNESFRYVRASKELGYFELPEGSYGITNEISTNDPATSHVLPVGSILKLETMKDPQTMPVEDTISGQAKNLLVYPVSGTIQHPTTRTPLEVTGYFNRRNFVTELTYSYPMNQGQTIFDAVIRCHLLLNKLRCAGHNKHWSRKRFVNVVEGLKAK